MMLLISAFLVFAAMMLFAILFIDEDTFINLTVVIGSLVYGLIALALLILLL